MESYNFKLELNRKTIKILRYLVGVTREEFAESCRVSKSLLASIEQGNRGISKLTNYRILTGFMKYGFSIEEIIAFNMLIDLKTNGGCTNGKEI
ncbi:helix-turn-helix domain-containing protein [Bacillus sp. BP-3]|uniref:helix-turn-helix domain-containing protein n=1 Tax=Bacillus sp. BP-3 TaxID=3022773 RepID=UPI00232FD539|nr:helix-turn-helix transcriptional regulator [Bacillus sp. BP-3]MDC2864004.1 helix-turn-helix transcriptional regulator [Bacillus sp. BP-3]